MSSSNERRITETAEAVCSALYNLGWVLLGEPTGARGTTWFIRGHDETQLVRVSVTRNWDDDNVLVVPQWRNWAAAPRVLRGHLDIRINCNGMMTTEQLEAATTAAVRRCLEVFEDVVNQRGVASAAYAAAHTTRPGTT